MLAPTPHPVVTDAAVMFTVHGSPAPQGSKRAFRNQHTGRVQMTESSKRVAPWRQDVKHAALEVIGESWVLLDGPLAVSMVFTFPRPRSHWRTGRNAHLLRDSAPARPSGAPDLSKLIRATEDALNGVVWTDDARVVEYVRLGKFYAGTPVGDVLTTPGCVIRIWSL